MPLSSPVSDITRDCFLDKKELCEYKAQYKNFSADLKNELFFLFETARLAIIKEALSNFFSFFFFYWKTSLLPQKQCCCK